MSREAHRVRFGAFEFDAQAGELRKGGRKVKLQGQPIQILGLLLEEPGEVITREELQKKLWPSDTFVDFEHSLNAAIKRLRDALDDSASTPRFVETLARRGYRFICPVEGISGAGIARASGVTATPHTRQIHRGLALAAVLAAVALGSVWAHRTGSRRSVGAEGIGLTKITEGGRVSKAAISADGRYVAYVEGNALKIRHIATRSDVQILSAQEGLIRGLTFAPDGNHIFLSEAEAGNPFQASLFKLPVLGGQAQKLLVGLAGPVSFSPDGHEFAFARAIAEQNKMELRIASADGSRERLLASVADAFFAYNEGAAWSPDGKTIALPIVEVGQRQRYVLDVVEVATGKVRELYSNLDGIGRPVWLGEGQALAVPLCDETDHDRAQLWKISYPSGERTRLTNDLSDYRMLDATAERKTLVTVQSNLTSGIWTVKKLEQAAAKQVTPAGLAMVEVTTLTNNKLVARNHVDAGLWVMTGDGSNRTQLGEHLFGLLASPCGKGIVFVRGHANAVEIVRSNSDGANELVVAKGGDLWGPVCSPDERYLYYEHVRPPARIVRVAVDGGTEKQIAFNLGSAAGGKMTISPDGRYLAYRFTKFGANSGAGVAVISAESGALVEEMPSGEGMTPLLWSRDGRSSYFVRAASGVANVWERSQVEKAERQVTHFEAGGVLDFAWSSDGTTLYVVRGQETADVVLIHNPI